MKNIIIEYQLWSMYSVDDCVVHMNPLQGS